MPQISRPYVAVITPLRNDPVRVIDTIKSVQSQTMQNYVHYIADDKSDDHSRNVVHNYVTANPDAHILFASFSEPKGRAETKNFLIQHALVNKPEYIAFLNSGDIWLPTHLEQSLYFIQREMAAMACSQPILMDANGTELQLSPHTDNRPNYFSLSVANTIHTSTVLMTIDCFEQIGEFDTVLDGLDEWDYWLRIVKNRLLIVRGYFNTVKCEATINAVDNIDSAKKHFIFKQKHKLLEPAKLKLNLGCGNEILDGYVNCDLYEPKADVWCDATKLPFPDNSVDEIRAYHLIEHFSYWQSFSLFKEWFRVLKPNGMLVVETPDFLNNCKKFVESDDDTRVKLYAHFFAFPDIPGQAHLFLYSEAQLHWSLSVSGFTNVRRVKPDSNYFKVNPDWEDLYLKMVAIKPDNK